MSSWYVFETHKKLDLYGWLNFSESSRSASFLLMLEPLATLTGSENGVNDSIVTCCPSKLDITRALAPCLRNRSIHFAAQALENQTRKLSLRVGFFFDSDCPRLSVFSFKNSCTFLYLCNQMFCKIVRNSLATIRKVRYINE